MKNSVFKQGKFFWFLIGFFALLGLVYFLELLVSYGIYGWCCIILPNLVSYVYIVVFHFIFHLLAGFYWAFVYVPYGLLLGGSKFVTIFNVLVVVFNLSLNLLSFSLFIVGRLCLGFMDYFLDFLRIFGSLGFSSFSPYQVNEGKRVGLQFSSLFLFKPFLPYSLTETGFFLGFPEAAEVFLFQTVYVFFQIIWSVLFLGVYVTDFFLNFGFTIFMMFTFLNPELVQKVWSWFFILSVNNTLVCVGLGVISITSFMVFCFFYRVTNFFNFQTIFSFISPNNWFGLNLAPGFSTAQILASSFMVRIAFIHSGFTRLESLIIFTSHLRFDPKTVDLPLW